MIGSLTNKNHPRPKGRGIRGFLFPEESAPPNHSQKSSVLAVRRTWNNGYTLIELLVALAIFSVVVIMIAGLISRLVFIERRDIGEQAVQEDVRFALEVFSREARLAYASTFALADDTGKSIVMRNQNGNCVNYRLSNDSGALERAEVSEGGTDCLSANFDNRFSPLVSSRMQFDFLRFDVPDSVYNLADARLDRQGFITVMLKARAKNSATPPLELQTTITSRQIKVYEAQ